jgi:N6-adenosine-specific RNA methylase IME4
METKTRYQRRTYINIGKIFMNDLPTKKYGVIYADPPWYFKTRSDKGKDKSPERHYPCMPIADIIRLPVNRIAKDNAVLLMWVVDPLLDQAFKVIDAWGFKYKTVGFTWAKTNRKSLGFFTGLGYWTRGNPEMCLLATKGRPKRIHKDVAQLVVSERRRHSEKPLLHKEIERLVEGPYLEMFARKKPYENWDYWGNEV